MSFFVLITYVVDEPRKVPGEIRCSYLHPLNSDVTVPDELEIFSCECVDTSIFLYG